MRKSDISHFNTVYGQVIVTGELTDKGKYNVYTCHNKGDDIELIAKGLSLFTDDDTGAMYTFTKALASGANFAKITKIIRGRGEHLVAYCFTNK